MTPLHVDPPRTGPTDKGRFNGVSEPPPDYYDDHEPAPIQPADITAEKALLGALLLEPHRSPDLATAVDASDFYRSGHETIWNAIHAVTATNPVHDPLELGDQLLTYLTKHGHISRIGGAPYLHTLMQACPNPLNADYYAAKVRNAARRRRVAEAGQRLIQIATTGTDEQTDQALTDAVDTLDDQYLRFGPRPLRSDTGIQYLSFSGLFDRPPTAVHWHVRPLIAAGRSSLLYSPGKAGKSLIAIESAAALAAGRKALSTVYAAEPTHVLYVDQEMIIDDWQDRLAAMGYAKADEALFDEFLHLAQLQAWPPMDTAAGGKAVHAEAEATGAQVVIIDTASKVISGEENANDTQQAFYRHTVVPLKRAGIGVLVLDHTGKDLDRGARGGSAKTDNVDLAFELSLRGRDLLTMRCSHARFRDQALMEPTFLRRETDPLMHIVEIRKVNEKGGGTRPTHLMDKVWKYVAANPGASRTIIETANLGRVEYVRMAIDLLVLEGYLAMELGPRKAQQHRVVRPYEEYEQEQAAPPRPDPVHDPVQTPLEVAL